MIAGGNVQGAIDLGGGPLAVPPGHALLQRDAFVARYRASDGAHAWSRLIAGTDDVGVDRLLVDEAGHLFVTGDHDAIVDFGGLSLSTPFTSYGARLDPATGAAVWATETGAARLTDVRDGRLLATGGFQSARLMLLDPVNGATLEVRHLEGKIELGDAVIAGGHAWLVFRVFEGGSVDGLRASNVPGSPADARWLVRLGL